MKKLFIEEYVGMLKLVFKCWKEKRNAYFGSVAMKYVVLLLTSFLTVQSFSQKVLGIIADSITHQPLPFATVQASNNKASLVADINGRFSISILESTSHLQFSYTGHKTKILTVSSIEKVDTVFLAPAGVELTEIIIAPIQDKIRRIVNTAVAHKKEHNPELYDFYQCNVYYKMHADLIGLADDRDVFFRPDKHLIFSETYSRRVYKRTQQLQETILASRFSGLKKTYFSNMITDMLPFHIYSNYILLNDKEYVNPIAAGWQQHYRFRLEDELTVDNDTVYVLAFTPKKGVVFNSLRGVAYINTNGYAISHMVASTGDTTVERTVRFEQIYTYTNGKWFPKELNYDFTIKHLMNAATTLEWNGHSVIDSISYQPLSSNAFDKAHSLKLADSIDLHTEQDWARFRKDTISVKEQNTYHYLDSFVRVNKLEQLITATARLNVGRLPIGKLDVDVKRLFASNSYEGTRLGLGLYTNDKISKYYSVGGWAGYGFKDKAWKYGASATIYPNGKRENWLAFAYQKNIGSPGEVVLHEELQNGLSGWRLGQVDLFEEYSFTSNFRAGYWELRPAAKWETPQPLYQSNFTMQGKTPTQYTNKEASLGIRYAYGEKRFPVFDYYVAGETKYPIAYVQVGKGVITATDYKADYLRVLAAVTYNHHTNRWGKDWFRVDGGVLRTANDQPLPQSYLLAGNGFNTSNLSFYASYGFITMKPYDYYSDRYAAFYYRHDFDKYLWDKRWSKPFFSLAHNLVYGSLSRSNAAANNGIHSFSNGYHESGLLINQLLRMNISFADLYFTAGAFYHWNKARDWQRNSAYVIGISAGL